LEREPGSRRACEPPFFSNFFGNFLRGPMTVEFSQECIPFQIENEGYQWRRYFLGNEKQVPMKAEMKQQMMA